MIEQSAEQSEDNSDPDRAGYNGQDLDFDDPLENFEDVLPETFSKWLDYNGKKILKTSFVATLSTAHSKKLTVQTFWNMGLTLETLLNSKRHDHELDADNDVDLMRNQILLLAWCNLGP